MGLLHAEAALGRVAQAEHRFAGAAALHLPHLGRAQHAAGDPEAEDTIRRVIAGAQQAGDL